MSACRLIFVLMLVNKTLFINQVWSKSNSEMSLHNMVLINDFYIDKYEFPNQANEYPIVNVTFSQAESMCNQVGKRLCTEQEWQQAAAGPESFSYGYSNTFESGRCNTPILQNSYWKSGKSLAKSGSFSRCFNSYKLFDMIGNAWEWTNGWYSEYQKWRVVRGGSYFNSANMARAESRYGQFLHEQFRLDLIGFRCCLSVRNTNL